MSLARQVTLGIIKPDVFRRPNSTQIVQNIFQMISQQGFKVLQQKQLDLSLKEAEEFYSDHRGRFFYQRLVSSMMSGPIIPFVLYKKDADAITQWRTLMGPTHAQRARQESPSSIRGNYGLSDTKNCVHGSDSPENALQEIKFFFPNIDINCEITKINAS